MEGEEATVATDESEDKTKRKHKSNATRANATQLNSTTPNWHESCRKGHRVEPTRKVALAAFSFFLFLHLKVSLFWAMLFWDVVFATNFPIVPCIAGCGVDAVGGLRCLVASSKMSPTTILCGQKLTVIVKVNPFPAYAPWCWRETIVSRKLHLQLMWLGKWILKSQEEAWGCQGSAHDTN